MSDCQSCPVEQDCHYPYKPCDCVHQRKFWSKERRKQHDAPNGSCERCGKPCAVFGSKYCPECHRQDPEYLDIPRFLRKQND